MDDKVARENIVVDARDIDFKQASLDQEQRKEKALSELNCSHTFLNPVHHD